MGETGPVPAAITGTTTHRAVGDDVLRLISTSISDDRSQKDKVQARQLSALMRPNAPRPRAAAQDQDDSRARYSDESKQQIRRPPNSGHIPTMRPPPGFSDEGPRISSKRKIPPMRPPPGFTTGIPLTRSGPHPTRPTATMSMPSVIRPSTFRNEMGNEEAQTVPRPPFRNEGIDGFFRPDGEAESMYPSKSHMDSSYAQRKPRKRPRLDLNSKAVALREDLENLDVCELEDLIEHLGQRAKPRPFRYLILYRISQSGDQSSRPYHNSFTAPGTNSMPLYFDPPQWTKGQVGPGVLQSQLPVTNFDLYLEKNKDISFIVYKTYSIPLDIPKTQNTRDRNSIPHDLGNAVVDESIHPVNETLVNAIEALLEAEDEYASILEGFRETCELKAPYLFVFHQRNERERILQLLPESSHQQMAMLWDYVILSQGAEYAAADSRISIGNITAGTLKYLFRPGQLLVQRQDDEIQG